MPSGQSDRNFSLVRVDHGSRTDASVGARPVNVFTKGQLVRWKLGLNNCRFPDHGEPAIQVLIFDPSENAAGSPYFQEPLTIVIGTCRETSSSSSVSMRAGWSHSIHDPRPDARQGQDHVAVGGRSRGWW